MVGTRRRGLGEEGVAAAVAGSSADGMKDTRKVKEGKVRQPYRCQL